MSDFTSPPSVPLTQPPHPFLTQPKLYISNLSPDVTDADLAKAFETCTPIRPNIQRTGATGSLRGDIDFKYLESAERALATLQSRPLFPQSTHSILVLSPFPPADPPAPIPPPLALPRLIKHLPRGTTDAQLFDLFRPFGPIAAVRNPASFGPDTGVIEYWNEDDAKRAEEAMHCAEFEGNNIAVQVYQPRRGAHVDFNASAAPFVPSAGLPTYTPSSPGRAPFQSTYTQSYHTLNPGRGTPSPFVHGSYPSPPKSIVPASTQPSILLPYAFEPGPGQQVQFAPLVGPGSGSQSGLIDPCNLFCKNLDPAIDSNDLFSYFRPFGQIVSARVMRGDNGQSRGFGFVSYQAPEQATHAMHAMNGQMLGTKQIQVRLHEPKQLRQEKLAQRFAQAGAGRLNASGSTSPALSDGAESPGRSSDRIRRGSGSYYNAAMAGNLALSWELDELQSLSPVVRQEVLTGELGRRVKNLETVPAVDLDRVVNALVSLSLAEVVQGIHNAEKFAAQVKAATQHIAAESQLAQGIHDPEKFAVQVELAAEQLAPESKPAQGATGQIATESSSIVLPSAPNTPTAVGTPLLTPPRTSSPSGSLAVVSDRDRLVIAVSRLESDPDKCGTIADLLLTLTKKERALCIFNVEYLKTKVAEAREVLDADDVEDAPASYQSAPAAPNRPPTSPVPADNGVKSASAPAIPQSLPTPTTSPQSLPTSPSSGSKTYTLTSLALLPAKEIIKLAESPSEALTGLPLPKADPLIIKATDEFVDSLVNKPIQQQKQLVGEKLFRVIKAFNVKGAPKITIALLDTEDLRALSHLMNSYPAVLKEKVLQHVTK